MRRTRSTRYWVDKYPYLVAVAAARRQVTWQEVVGALTEASRHHLDVSDDELLADIVGYMRPQLTLLYP